MTLADKLNQPLPLATQQVLNQVAESWLKLAETVSEYAQKIGDYFRHLFNKRKASPAFATEKPSPKTIQPTCDTVPIRLKQQDFNRFTFQLSPPVTGLKVTLPTAMRGQLAYF